MYEWIYHLAEKIEKENSMVEVVIVCDDNDVPMQIEEEYGFRLCDEARYIQRKYDLLKAGKTLGVKRLQNLRYKNGCVDIEKLTVSLQLLVLMNRYNKIYWQDVELLNRIIPAICEMMGVNCCKFGGKKYLVGNKLPSIIDELVGI